MRLRHDGWIAPFLSCLALVAAQTYTDCNPMEQSCPANPALGDSANYDFTQGASNDFTEVMSPSYGSDGAVFTVSKQGDAPLLQSNWYIMFGHVEFVIKAAPGTGIVSSAVLQSDDLDEIDWEWLGGNDQKVQTNYFGKGNTGTYNRAATHDNPNNHDDFHTYTIDWTKSHVVWQIDGKTVRVLTPESAEENQFPQTPMMVRVGVWAGGDPSNNEGTIQWAGGETDYTAGPFTMYMKSLKVTDYSTGNSYTYSDKSGSWGSITADGGKVNGNSAAESMTEVGSVPSITATANSGPIPFEGTHRETTSFTTPSVFPWIPRPSTNDGSKQPPSTDLPGDWHFAGAGNAQPPSRSSMSEHCPHFRFVPSSNFMLKRCLFTTQYTPPSTSALPHFSSDSSSPSGLEFAPQRHQAVFSETKQAEQYGSTIDELGNVQDISQQSRLDAPYTTSASYTAPTVNGASRVLDGPLIAGALCALVGGWLASL